MVCQLFSPYGEKEAVLLGCFQKHFSNIRPRKRAKVRRFSKKILKTDLLPYGETWAVLTSVFQTFSSLSAIRRKTCRFDQVFSQNFFASSTIRRNEGPFVNLFSRKRFAPLIYGHAKGKNLTSFHERIPKTKNCLRSTETVDFFTGS